MVILLAASFMGLASIVFAQLSNGSYIAILGFPALIILGMLFIFNRNLLFLLIIVSRVSLDPFIVNSKMGALGLGAVLNVLVIIMAILALPKLTQSLKVELKYSWGVFCAVLIVALVFSTNRIDAIKFFVNLISNGAIFVIALSLIKSQQDYAKWLRVVLYSSLIPIGYALFEKAVGHAQFYGSEGFRLQGTFYHPNVLGFYSVLMVSICLLIVKANFKVFPALIKNTLPLYVLMILVILVFTKTRSAWLAGFVFALIYGLLFERRYLVYLALVMGGAFFVPEVQDRLLNLQQGEVVWGHGQLNSYSWRKLLWESALTWMSPIKYFFGYGLDSFSEYSSSFFTLNGDTKTYAHNIYVQMFFEIGFFGLSAYLYLNYRILKSLIIKYKYNPLVTFVTISFILEYALFAYSDNMFGYLSFNWSFWFILGISLAYLDFKAKSASGTLPVDNPPITV